MEERLESLDELQDQIVIERPIEPEELDGPDEQCYLCLRIFQWTDGMTQRPTVIQELLNVFQAQLQITSWDNVMICPRCLYLAELSTNLVRVFTRNLKEKLEAGNGVCPNLEPEPEIFRYFPTDEMSLLVTRHTSDHLRRQIPSPAEIFSCTSCSEKFHRKSGLTSHQNAHRKEEARRRRSESRMSAKSRVFRCKHCPGEFTKLSDMNRHKEAHYRRQECFTCNQSFKTKYDYDWHMTMCVSQSAGLEQNEDEGVGRMTRSRSSLSMSCPPWEDVSSEDEEVCLINQNAPSSSPKKKDGPEAKLSTLLEFLHQCGEEITFSCEVCCDDVIFSNLDAYTLHMKKVHNQLSLYWCTMCRKQYTSKWHYNMHQSLKHLENWTACLYCGYFAYNLEVLSKHMEKHATAEYTCPKCDKTFFSVLRHQAHLESHCDELQTRLYYPSGTSLLMFLSNPLDFLENVDLLTNSASVANSLAGCVADGVACSVADEIVSNSAGSITCQPGGNRVFSSASSSAYGSGSSSACDSGSSSACKNDGSPVNGVVEDLTSLAALAVERCCQSKQYIRNAEG